MTAEAYRRDPDAYEALLTDISAGVRLHYGHDELVRGTEPVDPDLALLDGDRRYAEGLIRLAELGDLETTRILGDAISAVARAHAEGEADAAKSAWEQALLRIRS